MNKFFNIEYFWVRWTLATACGPFVGLIFLFCSIHATGWWTTGVPLSLVLFGTLMGVGQWAVLRRYLKTSWPWIPLTVVGVFFGIPLGLLSASRFVEEHWDIWASIIIGTVLGLAQWGVLYRQVRSSIWWIPASILSWGVGMTVILAADGGLVGPESIFGYASLGLLLGILVGAISGIFLLFLLRRPRTIQEAG